MIEDINCVEKLESFIQDPKRKKGKMKKIVIEFHKGKYGEIAPDNKMHTIRDDNKNKEILNGAYIAKDYVECLEEAIKSRDAAIEFFDIQQNREAQRRGNTEKFALYNTLPFENCESLDSLRMNCMLHLREFYLYGSNGNATNHAVFHELKCSPEIKRFKFENACFYQIYDNNFLYSKTLTLNGECH